MVTFDSEGHLIEDVPTDYVVESVVSPENETLDEFFNELAPHVVPTPEVCWSKVIDEIDGLRIRQFREARSLFYINRTAVAKTDAIYPFHEPDDTFNSCIEALTAVSGIEPPELSLRSDPAIVYSWCVKACLQFGSDFRSERTDGGSGGSGEAPSTKRPRLSKEANAEALQLLSKLNRLLG
jgi:hypothetical protein